MKEKIRTSVRTAYSKFGLKEASIEKIVNIVEAKLTTLGTQEAEFDTQIALEITAFEPFVGIIQSEVDSRKVAAQVVAPIVTAAPIVTPPPTPNIQDEPEWAKKIREKMEAQELKEIESQKKVANETRISEAKKLLVAAGAKNKNVIEFALTKAVITDDMTAEQISATVLPLYNTEYKETFGDGSAPIFAQKNVTAEEKKGRQESVVEFVKKYAEQELGVKQTKKE